MWQPAFSKVGEFLEYTQVFDETDADALGEDKNFYQTRDGGITWVSFKPDLPDEGFISSLTFSDLAHGNMSAVKTSDSDPGSLSSSILETSDGGKTWFRQFEIKAAEIRKVVVENRGNVWAVGRRIAGGPKLIENRHVILLNNGSGWREVSGPDGLGSVENVYITEDLTKIFIDTDGNIFSLNTAMEWNPAVGIREIKPQQIAVSNLNSTPNGKTFLFGSTGGREGIWTSIFSKDEYADRWRHYRLKDVILRDQIVVSSDEIIACGSIRHEEKNSAVILHSFDGGSSWLLTLKTDKSKSFISLWRKSADQISAIGENGEIVHLRKSID